jgi:hemin uptake protein HemP
MENTMHRSGNPSTEPNAPLSAQKKNRIESRHLFQDHNEIIIVHQNEEYSLRITRNGKLILTK